MKDSLQPGVEHEFEFPVPESKTVPNLYPESDEFRAMPEVFATGFFVGLIEWTCIQAINPHLDCPREQTVGTHLDVSHVAPTPPDMAVSVKVRLIRVDGRRLLFEFEASDEAEEIGRGKHGRYIVDAASFREKAARKGEAARTVKAAGSRLVERPATGEARSTEGRRT